MSPVSSQKWKRAAGVSYTAGFEMRSPRPRRQAPPEAGRQGRLLMPPEGTVPADTDFSPVRPALDPQNYKFVLF